MTEVVLASTFERYLPLIILQCLSYVNDLCSDLDINDAIILFVLAIGILQLVCLIWYTLLRLAKYLNDTLQVLPMLWQTICQFYDQMFSSRKSYQDLIYCARCERVMVMHGRQPKQRFAPVDLTDCIEERNMRLSFNDGKAIACGWPATGGVLIKEVSAVEMDWLQLSRVQESIRSHDASEEAQFCRRLRMLGARWYLNGRAYSWRHSQPGYPASRSGCCVEWSRDLLPDLEVGVSEMSLDGTGGAWILRISLEDGFEAERQRCLLQFALNMEERCQVIKILGGQFVEVVGEQPGLASCGKEEEAKELRRRRAAGMHDYDDEEEELRKLQEEIAW